MPAKQRSIGINPLYETIDKVLYEALTSLQEGGLIYGEELVKKLQKNEAFKGSKKTKRTLLGMISRSYKKGRAAGQFKGVDKINVRLYNSDGTVSNIVAYERGIINESDSNVADSVPDGG
jgi:hypothetical protein